MRYLRVRNWTKFQHYKDRNPTWIKLYVELQEKWEFMTLPDAAKAHVCGIFMLAARRGNRIPADAAFISQQIGATEQVDLELLMAPGREFLEYDVAEPAAAAPVLAAPSASGTEVLAEPGQERTNVGTDTIRKREQRDREQNHPQTPASKAGARTLTQAEAVTIAYRIAARFRELLGKAPPKALLRAWRAELRQGVSEGAIVALIEAEAGEERLKADVDAAEKARWAAARDWVDRFGVGRQIVAQSALEQVELKRKPGESVDDALKRWCDEGGFPREVLGVIAHELYELRKQGRGERKPAERVA